MELVIEGVLSIQAGENLRIIKEKIKAILENNMNEDEMRMKEFMNKIEKLFFKVILLCMILTGALCLSQAVYADSSSDFQIEDGKLTGYHGLDSNVVIPNEVTSIGSYAFAGCSTLNSITIPDSVTSIGSYAFNNCTSLSSVTIPGSVTSIDYGAFFYCTSLTSIRIPNGVTSIGDSAFNGCSSLTSITIPSSLANIEGGAGPGLSGHACENLEEIIVEDGNEKFESRDGVLFKKTASGVQLSVYPANKEGTEYIIPDDVTDIGKLAFHSSKKLTGITIPNGVTSIGDSAFAGCKKITAVAIPDSVTSIGQGAFSFCTKLASISIPKGVTSLKICIFYLCKNLTRVTIPDSVTSIGYRAFYGCSSLTALTIPKSVKNIKCDAFFYCDRLKTLKMNVSKGKKVKIRQDPYSESGKVAYTSSNKEIASISKNGTVSAKKKGKAQIVIKYSKNKKVLTKTVLKITVK